MSSFPLINELPETVDTTGWTWERFNGWDNFWLGTDLEGKRWLTKLRGSFRAYREIVFARLAQAMNWSHQSSVFMRLDKLSAQKLGADADKVHAAHWFLNEHKHGSCSMDCALEQLDKQKETLEDLMESKIIHLLDWPKSAYAAYLFGGHEPPGTLFTTAHEFVIIDSELMFATGPEQNTAHWWYGPDGRPPSRMELALALEVCRNLTSLSEHQIEEALRIPTGIKIRKDWSIAPKLKASRKFAAQFCASHKQV